MAFISDKIIRKKLDTFFPEQDFIGDEDHRPNQLQASSFELRLGDEVFISGTKQLVSLGEQGYKYTVIKPGDFAILLTLEKVHIPKEFMAFISIRTKYKNMGLINISGFHVDPGFEGKLTFSVYNAGPNEIPLRHKEKIFIIFFSRIEGEVEKPYSQLPNDHEGQSKIKTSYMSQLTGRSVSPLELSERLTKLEHTTQLQWGLLAATAIGVFAVLLGVLTGQ